MIEIISYSEAKAIGQKWYFTGRPCRKGHVTKRSTSNRYCRGCQDAKDARQRRENPARLRAKDKRKYHRDPEKRRRLQKESYERHIEKRRAGGRAAYRKNPDAAMQRKKAWEKANPDYLRYQSARRRARIAQAMPPWLTDQHLAEIRAMYATAPVGAEVDHIIPLRGKTVCGLHVPWNLQHLEKVANRSKGNRHE